MVALKLADPIRFPRLAMEKQERRGGIETRVPPQPGPPTPGKQERRGGIETKNKRGSREKIESEAGTPWWH